MENQPKNTASENNTHIIFIEHITYCVLVSLKMNHTYCVCAFYKCNGTKCYRWLEMNHFENVDIVKLRQRASQIIRVLAVRYGQTELKGISTHTQTPSHSTIQRRRFNFLLFNSIVWVPLVFFVHPSQSISSLCLSFSRWSFLCCFCKLHRTIILVWLHFGGIYTCFSFS